MRDKPATPGQEQHLRDYWRVVWNGRWTVTSIFAVVLVLGTISTLLQKPVYEAGHSRVDRLGGVAQNHARSS